jgi:hypothetical protein
MAEKFPKIIELTEPTEIKAIREDCTLAVPFLMESNGHVYCDAAELRAWRVAIRETEPHR